MSTVTSGCTPGQMTIGTVCQLTMQIQFPVNEPTNFGIKIFSKNQSQMLILGRPSFTYGTNYNLNNVDDPWVQLNSSYNDSRVIYFKKKLAYKL